MNKIWIVTFLFTIPVLHSPANLTPCYCVITYCSNDVLPRRWRSFKRQMLNMRSHSDSKGFELKRPNDSIYTFPCPDCMSRRNKTTTPESRPPPATWKHTFDYRPSRICFYRLRSFLVILILSNQTQDLSDSACPEF